MADKGKFDESEFLQTLERVARDQAHGDVPTKPGFDPREHAERKKEMADGRTVGLYRQALERAGMRYVPAHLLGLWQDGTPHTEGQWFHMDVDLGIAFTETDILAYFSTPQELYLWIERKVMEKAARGVGLILPSRS